MLIKPKKSCFLKNLDIKSYEKDYRSASIKSILGNPCRIRADREYVVQCDGANIDLVKEGGTVEFATEKNKVYHLSVKA